MGTSLVAQGLDRSHFANRVGTQVGTYLQPALSDTGMFGQIKQTYQNRNKMWSKPISDQSGNTNVYNVPQKLDHPISLDEGPWGERNDVDAAAAA